MQTFRTRAEGADRRTRVGCGRTPHRRRRAGRTGTRSPGCSSPRLRRGAGSTAECPRAAHRAAGHGRASRVARGNRASAIRGRGWSRDEAERRSPHRGLAEPLVLAGGVEYAQEMLRATNGPAARDESAWIARAVSSSPVPLSPRMSACDPAVAANASSSRMRHAVARAKEPNARAAVVGVARPRISSEPDPGTTATSPTRCGSCRDQAITRRSDSGSTRAPRENGSPSVAIVVAGGIAARDCATRSGTGADAERGHGGNKCLEVRDSHCRPTHTLVRDAREPGARS